MNHIQLEMFMALLIFLVGLFNLIRSRNLVKSIIALTVLNTSLILFFVLLSSQIGKSAPILGDSTFMGPMIDPLPQALMITAIVIEAAVTALGLMMSIKLFHYYGSLEWEHIYGRRD